MLCCGPETPVLDVMLMRQATSAAAGRAATTSTRFVCYFRRSSRSLSLHFSDWFHGVQQPVCRLSIVCPLDLPPLDTPSCLSKATFCRTLFSAALLQCALFNGFCPLGMSCTNTPGSYVVSDFWFLNARLHVLSHTRWRSLPFSSSAIDCFSLLVSV